MNGFWANIIAVVIMLLMGGIATAGFIALRKYKKKYNEDYMWLD